VTQKQGKTVANVVHLSGTAVEYRQKSNRDYTVFLFNTHRNGCFTDFRLTFRDNFILKGALLFLTYDMPQHRPTKDIDFLGRACVATGVDDPYRDPWPGKRRMTAGRSRNDEAYRVLVVLLALLSSIRAAMEWHRAGGADSAQESDGRPAYLAMGSSNCVGMNHGSIRSG